MTTTASTTAPPRTSRLDHALAMRLAATEYGRFADLLRGLRPADWQAPTECTGWDVQAMAAHLLGMADMAASLRESRRQTRAAHARGGVFIDALTALQVEEHRGLAPDELVRRYEAAGAKAAKARRRVPWFIRRRRVPEPQTIGGVLEIWTVGYLMDVILTRDPWMHRIDIARATGAPLVHTAEHDGVLVDDVVREWAGRHGRPCTLRLTGPAGGTWSFGEGGEALEYDAVDFCRALSGRGELAPPFGTEVPF
jgi:uncharacterized protein (TIGR03083 family)